MSALQCDHPYDAKQTIGPRNSDPRTVKSHLNSLHRDSIYSRNRVDSLENRIKYIEGLLGIKYCNLDSPPCDIQELEYDVPSHS